MKKLQTLLQELSGSQLSRDQMKTIKGGVLPIADKCSADCPSSTPKTSVTCECQEGETCFARDDAYCSCSSLTGITKKCPAPTPPVD